MQYGNKFAPNSTVNIIPSGAQLAWRLLLPPLPPPLMLRCLLALPLLWHPPSPADWLCTPFPGTRPAATGTQLYEPNTGDKLSGWTVQGVRVSQWALGGY